MVKKILFVIFMVFPLAFSFANYPSPREIVNIKINETGKSDDESINVIDGCQSFKITEKDVREFFTKAYPVPWHFNLHDRYSPCYAKGFIEFSNNTRGKWKIFSSGGGTLLWDTGDVAALFYENYQWTDPFEGTYTSEDETNSE